MAPQQVQWGTITLHLDNETFRKSFTDGRRMYFDDSEDDFPHVTHRVNVKGILAHPHLILVAN